MYEPQEDSYLLESQVKEHAFGRVLDIGTGTGIQALAAMAKGLAVKAVDIDPKAVTLAKQKGVDAAQSDLFSNVEGKFDTIIFNPPYLPKDYEVDDIALYGGKEGWETIARFLGQASRHLKKEGIILLLFSSLTNRKKIEDILRAHLFLWEQLKTTHQFFEDLFVYRITKSRLLKAIEKEGVQDVRYLAKGKRGIAYEGIMGRPVVIKTVNPDSKAVCRLENEAYWLAKVNDKGIGPRLIRKCDDFIIMEKAEGKRIKKFLEDTSGEEIISAINEMLIQCRILDRMRISKEEMHHPHKHIIIGEKVVLIDFDRARVSLKPRNVTQFCQYLCREEIASILKKKGIIINKEKILSAARNYRKTWNIGKMENMRINSK